MDEAIANARASQGEESFDESYITELHVKQKYMGHRNARYNVMVFPPPLNPLTFIYLPFNFYLFTLQNSKSNSKQIKSKETIFLVFVPLKTLKNLQSNIFLQNFSSNCQIESKILEFHCMFRFNIHVCRKAVLTDYKFHLMIKCFDQRRRIIIAQNLILQF